MLKQQLIAVECRVLLTISNSPQKKEILQSISSILISVDMDRTAGTESVDWPDAASDDAYPRRNSNVLTVNENLDYEVGAVGKLCFHWYASVQV